MTSYPGRAQRLSGASWLVLGLAATQAIAQDKPSTELPSVTVTAPSPIARRAIVPARPTTRVAHSAPRHHQHPPEPAPAPAAPQRGVLPVITNQFATVTLVPNEEIRRDGGGQLGDLLFAKQGSRPWDQGLGFGKPLI